MGTQDILSEKERMTQEFGHVVKRMQLTCALLVQRWIIQAQIGLRRKLRNTSLISLLTQIQTFLHPGILSSTVDSLDISDKLRTIRIRTLRKYETKLSLISSPMMKSEPLMINRKRMMGKSDNALTGVVLRISRVNSILRRVANITQVAGTLETPLMAQEMIQCGIPTGPAADLIGTRQGVPGESTQAHLLRNMNPIPRENTSGPMLRVKSISRRRYPTLGERRLSVSLMMRTPSQLG